MLVDRWKYIPFPNAAKVLSDMGKRIKQRDYLQEGKIPVIDQGQDFIGGYTDDENMAFEGDLPVIIFGDHTKNIKYVNRCFAVGAEGVKILKPVSCYEPKFFYYMLHSLEIPSRGYSRHFQFLKKFNLPVAPYQEQKLIVAEIEKQFSRLDEATTALKRIKANLKRYKASVLKAAVEGKLTEEWRKEHPDVEPASELLKRILAERHKKWEKEHPGKKYKEPFAPDSPNLPGLPKGWVWATLSQLGELNRGKSKHRPRNASHLYGGHYPFVQTGDVKNAKGFLRHYTQTYSDAGLKQSKLWPTGTLCITIAANIADTAILGFDACFPDSIVGFVAELSHCDVRFVEYFIRTAKKNIERYAPATAQKNINLEILSAVAVPLPPFSEQQFIVEEVERRLSVAEEIEIEIETNLKRAERLRQSILKKAFSGRLEVSK